MPGFVGGRPSEVGGSGADLRAAGERVAGLVQPYAEVTRAAIDAAGQGSPMVAVARCGAVWARALATLGDQVGALGDVATLAAADLAEAEGS